MTIQQAILANPNATDAEILAIVNAPVPRKIDLPTVRQLIAASGALVNIEYGKASSNEQVKYLCTMADKFLYLPFREDMVQLGSDHTQFLTLATSLQAAGVIDAETLAAVNALAFDVPTYTLADIALERRRGTRDSKAAAASATYNAYVAALDAAWQAGTDMDAVGALEVVA